MKNNRIVIKIGGESGQGINFIGEVIGLALKNSGYYTFGYREYPSLIKGGFSSYQIDFSDKVINSTSTQVDIAISLSRFGVSQLLKNLSRNGILIHSILKFKFNEEEQKFVEENNIQVVHVDIYSILKKIEGGKILENTILAGLISRILNIQEESTKKSIHKLLADKPKVLPINDIALNEGYKIETNLVFQNEFEPKEDLSESLIMHGNNAVALGSISAGVRAYYSYPMTPASSILEILADMQNQTGMVVKQAEDEITAIQMTLGSMHAGARALVATSGGGFDLMTESVSMAGMTEIPLVCILGQRPGPATGLPTWTMAGDLNLALYSGHGEFVRCVVAISDLESAFRLMGEAFNIAEKFQIPVIILTEKNIAESFFQIKLDLFKSVPIQRSLTTEESEDLHRYELTENGISPRWIPGSLNKTYNANSDEHWIDGELTEDADQSQQMMEKRMRKFESLKIEIPDEDLYGNNSGDILFVGWGSTKNTVVDCINISNQKKISYLHYEYLYPLKTSKLLEVASNFKKVVLIENNYAGQLGELIKKECGYEFTDKLLKYNGRPFFIEDILDYLNI